MSSTDVYGDLCAADTELKQALSSMYIVTAMCGWRTEVETKPFITTRDLWCRLAKLCWE